LRWHFVWATARVIDIAAAWSAGDFVRLPRGIFLRSRLNRLFWRRLRFDCVGLGMRVGVAGHCHSPLN